MMGQSRRPPFSSKYAFAFPFGNYAPNSILKVSGPTVELSPEDAKYREALERMVGERPKLFYMEAKPDEQADLV
jgi:hypothetical protein